MNYYMYKNGGNFNQQGQNYYNYNQKQNNRMELFVGPYCANGGKKILLGVFMDETCSYSAPKGIYEKLVSNRSIWRNALESVCTCTDACIFSFHTTDVRKQASLLQRLSRLQQLC
jgi:hypothetical protein